MKQTLTAICQYLAATLVVALCLSAFGCADTAAVSDEPAVPLSSLGVSPGSLQPGFSSNITSYTVRVLTTVSSVTVSARPKDGNATMTINGVVTSAGQGFPVPLGPPGSTTSISIDLASQTGGQSTYSITVVRPLSSNNNLSVLTVTPGPLTPAFDPVTVNYTVNVATAVTQVTVTATKSDPSAVMLIESILISPRTVPGGTPSSGPVNVSLTGPGTNTVASITLTAPNGSKKIYQITVMRAASSDNDLSALTVSAGTPSLPLSLAPSFLPSTLSYSVDVATDITEVTISATKSDPNAEMLIHSIIVASGTPSGQDTLPLNGPGAPTLASITVTAPSGDVRTYTITVNRAASNDNNLSALSLSALSLTGDSVLLDLNPPFDRNHLEYTVEVAFDVIQVIVTATKSDPNAVLSGSVPDPGTGVETGQATITFILLPPPQVSITVTAPNGSPKTYIITVNRALLPVP